MKLLLALLLLTMPVWAEEVPTEAATEVAAEAVATTEAPVAVEPKGLLNQTWADKYKDQPYVALVNEYETRIKPDWSYEETYHARIKIQKEEAKALGQWPIYYNKSRDSITDIKAHVEAPDGRMYPVGTIEDLPVYDDVALYDEVRMKLVTLSKVEVGSIIEVTVKSVTTRKEIPGHFWGEVLHPAIPTKRSSHTFIIPDDKNVKIKAYNMEYKPLISKTGGTTSYTFAWEETGAIPNEMLMPPLQDVLGAIYLSSMEDWKIMADWYRYLVDKASVDDAEITVRALELVKGKTTEEDKARAIFEFIQDNFRLIPLTFGDNMVLPHPTVDILKARYGDSKDLATLARQMLKLAGIEANICFFSSEFAGDPQKGLPNPSVFSSVILQMKLDGQLFYIDPMLKGYQFGHLPSRYDNGVAFVITDTDYHFDRLPMSAAEEHGLISSADITILPDGSAEYRVHIELSAETSESFKRSWEGYTTEQKDKFFLDLEKNFAKEGKILGREIRGVDSRYDHVQIDFRYQAPRAYQTINDMMLIKEEDQADLPEFVDSNRTYSIYVPNNSLIKNTNVYHVPDGFKVESLPASYSLSNDMMDATVNYLKKDDGTIQIDSTYVTKRANIPADRYYLVKDFRRELAKKNDQYVVLKKTSDVSPQAKDFINKE